MKMYKQLKPLFEMANITPKYSGLVKGVIQIRPEDRHIYFPHIHFVWNVKKAENEYIKLSLESNKNKIKIIEQKNIKIDNKQIEIIKDFITLNYSLLKEYYLQAEFLDTGEFFSLIVKV
jgi:hypothetical protein